MLYSGVEITDKFILDEFQQWIQARYKISSSQSWERVVLFYSTDYFEALGNFISFSRNV